MSLEGQISQASDQQLDGTCNQYNILELQNERSSGNPYILTRTDTLKSNPVYVDWSQKYKKNPIHKCFIILENLNFVCIYEYDNILGVW